MNLFVVIYTYLEWYFYKVEFLSHISALLLMYQLLLVYQLLVYQYINK